LIGEELFEYPLSGGIFEFKPEVGGLAPSFFKPMN